MGFWTPEAVHGFAMPVARPGWRTAVAPPAAEQEFTLETALAGSISAPASTRRGAGRM